MSFQRILGRSLAVLLLLSTSGCAAFFGRAISESDRSLALIHRDRAGLQLQRGQVELAIREYQNSIEINPYDPEAHFGYAEALRRKGLREPAEDAFREAISLDPAHHDAKINLAVLMMETGRYDEAIARFDDLLRDPTFLNPARGYLNRGWAHYRAGRPDAARRDLREAIVRDGALFQPHLNLGIVLYEQGETVEAIAQFERTLEILKPQTAEYARWAEAEAHFRLGQAYVKLAKLEDARDHLERAESSGRLGLWGSKAREYLELLD